MLIGIDVGTTAIKASVLTLYGKTIGNFNQSYPTLRLKAAQVEQNPNDWIHHVQGALQQFAEYPIEAIGLCSQVNTHVFVDADGKPLMPAITWQDGRCAEEAAKLDAQITTEEKIGWWGAPLPIDASHVLARMAYVRKHHPEIWNKTRWVMAPKDFCLFHLTGEVSTDPMTAFGIVDSQLSPIQRLFDLVPNAAERLPPIRSFTTVIGKVRKGLPCANVPVVSGAMDAWSGLLGAGVCEDGQGLYLSGTSEILGIVSSLKASVPGVIAFPKCEGIVFHAGPTQSGGASIEWLSRLLGKRPLEISALAATADVTKPLPIFLPHLEGERAPLWDIHSRASLSGIDSNTGAAEISRAVLEGVAYSARLVMDSLEVSACIRPLEINHSGGGSASDVWCQIRADVLGRPIKRTKMTDAGVLGAALIAGTGLGLFSSLNSAVKTLVKQDRIFLPNPKEFDRHADGFERYKLLYQQLVPWNLTLPQTFVQF